MATTSSMDPVSWLRQQFEHADVDLLPQMVVDFANALMSADVDAVRDTDYGAVSDERVNRRNATSTSSSRWAERALTARVPLS